MKMNIKNFNRKFTIFASKILILVQIFLLLFIIGVKANYQEFTTQLETMGMDVKSIESSNKISRYDLAKLLNTVECKDCINTPKDMIAQYDNKFWDAFIKIPGKDFADIKYQGGIYKGEIYYYCVAYVGENEYMRGYPLETSPVCGGKFCGSKETTQAEFYQVIINLSAKYIYNNFITDWKTVKKWMDKIKEGSYAYKYLNAIDRQYINENSSLNKSGYIDDVKYFATYMKYCMFNLESCGFQEIGSIKQAVWPIAELNVLLKQNIIDLPLAKKVDVGKLVNGKTVLEVLYKIYDVVKCDFNNDYDCDLSENAADNCPNSYNPSQIDTDKDGIGDVCDGDIDGDGITNPIGIVDDNGRINIGIWTTGTDLSLWGNDTLNNQIGIYINASNVKGTAPITVSFDAITKGNINKINRDMGDGTRKEGQKISHTFLYPGMYKIKATAYGNFGQATAKISLLIGESVNNQYGIQILTDKVGGSNDNLEITFNTRNIGNIDKVKWILGDGIEIWKTAGQKFKRILNKKGTYMVVVKGYKGTELKSIASVNIGAGIGNQGASLNVNTLNPSIGQNMNIETKIWGFDNNSIENVEINRGDGIKETSKRLLSYGHIYKVGGTRTISQKIILKNGKIITNFLTIYVTDFNLSKTYAYLINPNNLIANSYDKINFSTYIAGYILPNYPFIINQYKQGETKMFADIKSRPQKFDYIYNKKGIYNLISNLYVNQCVSMEAQASIGIKGNDICLDAMLNSTLSKFKCDMDKDGIPDLCDDDIDGDGYKNLIGIIKYENHDCSIGPANNIIGGSANNLIVGNNVDIQLLKKQIGSCSLDNAFPISNPDQMDLNMNGIGDIFENQIGIIWGNINPLYENNNDKDGDGVPDSIDLCPDIPENYNIFQDGDGCPEIGINQNCDIRLQFPNLGGLFDGNIGDLGGDGNGRIENDGGDGGGLTIVGGGFILSGGDIISSGGVVIYSGGVVIYSGSITWDGGTITQSGGLMNCQGQLFIGDGGVVIGNGGVIIGNGGIIIGNGGNINWIGLGGDCGNIGGGDGGGLTIVGGGLILSGGDIISSGGVVIYSGGVVIYSGSITWDGGTITQSGGLMNCQGQLFIGDGGSVFGNGGTVIGNGGIIIGNGGNINWIGLGGDCGNIGGGSGGGGLTIVGGGFILSGGDIISSGGVVIYSGGVVIYSGSITWDGGTITQSGGLMNCQGQLFIGDGGVVIGNGGVIIGNGGVIIGNGGNINWIGLGGDCGSTGGGSGGGGLPGGGLPGGGNNIPNIPPIIQSECFQCPCNFSDIMNDLSKKDAVRASLWDKLGNILYRVSESKSLDLNMD